jgi:serpin B
MVHSKLNRNTNPDVTPAEVQELSVGNNTFAFDLYKTISSLGGNLFYSPYSISLALAMTYAGARGETSTQIADSMQFTLSAARLHQAFNALELDLVGRSGNHNKTAQQFELNIANALWGQAGKTFQTEFLDLLASNYGTGMRLQDFRSAPEEARRQINLWVSEQTKDKIRDLVPLGLIHSMTKLVLVNAIYFKASWDHEFEESLTSEAPFTLLDGSQAKVPMMSFDMPKSLSYASGDGWQMVSLTYNWRKEEMLIFLPDAGRFEEFERQLTAEYFDRIIASQSG